MSSEFQKKIGELIDSNLFDREAAKAAIRELEGQCWARCEDRRVECHARCFARDKEIAALSAQRDAAEPEPE